MSVCRHGYTCTHAFTVPVNGLSGPWLFRHPGTRGDSAQHTPQCWDSAKWNPVHGEVEKVAVLHHQRGSTDQLSLVTLDLLPLTQDGGLSGDFLWSLGLDVWPNKEGSTVVAQIGFVMFQAAETMAQSYRECSSRHHGAAVILLFFISNTYSPDFL